MRRKQTASQLLFLAQNELQKHNFPSALKLLSQVCQLEPSNDDAHRLLADCHEQLQNYKQAQNYYQHCIDLNPLSIIGYTNYGLLLYKMGRKDQAKNVYELCVDIGGWNDKTVVNNFAILLWELGEFRKCQELCQRCLQLEPGNLECRGILGKLADIELGNKRPIQKACKMEQKQTTVAQSGAAMPYREQSSQIANLQKSLSQSQSLIESLQQKLLSQSAKIQKLQQQLEQNRMKQSKYRNSKQCKICLDRQANHVNTVCGHLSTCGQCVPVLKGKCGICRAQGAFLRVWCSLLRE